MGILGAQNVETIAYNAFCNTGIKKFTIPQSCTSVENGCFSSCQKLISVTWNDACTAIPDDCFSGCTSLKEISQISSVNKIGESAFEQTKFKEFIWPSSCSVIPKSCFKGTKSLKAFSSWSCVSQICDDAFTGTKIKSVDLSDNFTIKLGSNCFPEDTEVNLSFYSEVN
jgi:hypothetical protein